MEDRISIIKNELRELYPALSETQLLEAEQNLLRYLCVACNLDPALVVQPAPTFDNPPNGPTMKERSNSLKT